MRHALDEFAGDGGKPEVAHSLCERLFYVPGDLDNAQTYAALRTRLEAVDGDGSRPAGRGRLFYLAIPPSVYPEVIRHLHGSGVAPQERDPRARSEEHTSELQSRLHLVCRLLLEKKKD